MNRKQENADISFDLEGKSTNLEDEVREEMLDKTIADSFPTSDPPSSIPGPIESGSLPDSRRRLLRELPAGSWAAIALEDGTLAGTGATRDEAEQNARRHGHPNIELLQVPEDSTASHAA